MIKTELGSLQKCDEFILNDEKYKILGFCSSKSYNNILCQNIETKKRKWLDQATEVERNLCDTNPFNNNRFGG